MIRALKKQIKYIASPKYAYLKQFDVKPGDKVIDLGANVGEVAEYFLAKGAKVYAYEPNPHPYKIMQTRIGRHKNTALFPCAVSNFHGKTKLWLHREHRQGEVHFSQAASLNAEKNNVGEDFIEVDVLNIKDLLAGFEHIRLIKIDIEGGEYDIMEEILKNGDKIDFILLETHEKKNPGFQKKHDAMIKAIAQSGFEAKIYTDWF